MSVCRETRYFSTWKRKREVEEHSLPDEVREATQAGIPHQPSAIFALIQHFNAVNEHLSEI